MAALSRAVVAGVDQAEIDVEDRMEALTASVEGMEEVTWALAEDDSQPLESALVALYQAPTEGVYDAAVALRRLLYWTAVRMAEKSVAA